jgi:hypothetical protein
MGDPIVRDAIVELLPQLDAQRAAQELGARLNNSSESERVRARAAGELAHLDRAVAVPALLQALDEASDHAWAGARAILEALGLQGGAAVEAAVLQAFVKPTTTAELRVVAVQTLGLLRSKGAVAVLENTVRHEDRDHYIRREAVRALLRIDPTRAKELVSEQIDREPDAAFKEFLKSVAREASVGK